MSINSTKSNESNQYLNNIIYPSLVNEFPQRLINFIISVGARGSALTFEEFPVFVVVCNLVSFNTTYCGKLV